MNITTMITLAVLTATGAHAAKNERWATQSVKICIEGGVPVMAMSKSIVSKVFAGIGVKIEWQLCRGGRPRDAIRIDLESKTPATDRPGALAFSAPREGVHIRVFYSRIQNLTEWKNMPMVMANVLIHEITHCLQGVIRHSEIGVMKADWNEADLGHMMWKPLPFTKEDVKLIHGGMETRAARVAPTQ